MKLVSITARNGFTVKGLRLTTLPSSVAAIEGSGWRIHRRGPQIFFESPPDERGQRHYYERPAGDFDLNWEADSADDLKGTSNWSSPVPPPPPVVEVAPVAEEPAAAPVDDDADPDLPAVEVAPKRKGSKG